MEKPEYIAAAQIGNRLKSIRSYPEKMVGFLPFPFWASVLLLWTLIFVIDLWASRGISPGHGHQTELGITFFCAALSISIGLCARIMVNLFQDLVLFIEWNPLELETWYYNKLNRIYQGIWPLVSSFAFALIVEFTIGSVINSMNSDSEFLLYYRMGYRLFGFFLLGISLWALIHVMILPSQLLKFKFKLRLSNLSGIGLQALGNSFFKMSLTTIACLLILVITIVISPLKNNNIVLIWVGFGSILIFCFFLLPQIGIHRIMAIEKRQQLISFSNHLEEALARSMKEPTSENMQKLKELFDLQAYLKSMNDWPFNTNALWQLISALLIPLLLVILQIVFKL